MTFARCYWLEITLHVSPQKEAQLKEKGLHRGVVMDSDRDHPPPQIHAEALTSSMAVFGDGSSKEVITVKLSHKDGALI